MAIIGGRLAAEMAEEAAELIGCGLASWLEAAVQEVHVEETQQVYDEAQEALMQVEDDLEQIVDERTEEMAAERQLAAYAFDAADEAADGAAAAGETTDEAVDNYKATNTIDATDETADVKAYETADEYR